MAALVAVGITLQPRGRDRYGRLPARVRDQRGRKVATVLIREGLAEAYDGRGPRPRW
ncbi:thermonuclease family protein [Neoroseomonas terrae]|uniref:thermonuclease family protein n=1 Tax=Neoroseomonas terrae TaxID=424799 RepID=UPI0038D096E2